MPLKLTDKPIAIAAAICSDTSIVSIALGRCARIQASSATPSTYSVVR